MSSFTKREFMIFQNHAHHSVMYICIVLNLTLTLFNTDSKVGITVTFQQHTRH